MAKYQIEPLNKDNFDTWKVQMQALLIKTDGWQYANGSAIEPTPTNSPDNSAAVNKWVKEDQKAKSDIILAMSPSELKQIKECKTAREVWVKLESIYQSQGPAKKATLLKRLTLSRLKEGDDIRQHLDQFFDAVDKLREMKLEVNDDLLAIMLLYSLPPSFENFRCAIESRDDLPKPDALKIKVLEEAEARKSKNSDMSEGAFFSKKPVPQKVEKNGRKKVFSKLQCHRCQKFGHKAAECRAPKPRAFAAESAEAAYHATGRRSASVTECAYQCAVDSASNPECAFISGVKPKSSKHKWCLDSGATSHMSASKEKFEKLDTVSIPLNLASNQASTIEGMGSFRVKLNDGDGGRHTTLLQTLYVPDLRTNLMSVAKITDRGNEVTFRRDAAYVYGPNRDVLAVAEREGDLYFVREVSEIENANIAETRKKSGIMEWHERLGHLNEANLKRMAADGHSGVKFGPSEKLGACETCVKGKQTEKPFPTSTQERNFGLPDIVHTDICGPMRTASKSGAKYFAVFKDDYSRWYEVYFLSKRSEIFSVFKRYKAQVENVTGRRIKHLQSDNGTEYLTSEFNEFLQLNGIKRRLTVPHTPEQNGVSERKNRTFVETARCLMLQSKLPASFWAEAVNTANYLRNRCPSRVINGSSPFELWMGRSPNLFHCRPFGAKALALNKDPKKDKFDSRSKDCLMLGYCDESKAYRLWSTSEGKIIKSRDVKFLNSFCSTNEREGNVFPSDLVINKNEVSGQVEAHIEEQIPVQPGVVSEESDSSEARDDKSTSSERRGPGRPKMVKTGKPGRPKKQYHVREPQHDIPADPDAAVEEYVANLADTANPQSLQEALRSRESDEWRVAVAEEYLAHISNQTWDVVDLPPGCKPIGTRFVLKTKLTSKGEIERRKARLVAKGYAQRPGTDFLDTFAPVARATSIRLLMALATELHLSVHQMDVVTAFLNGNIEEELYLDLPEEIETTLIYVIFRILFLKNIT